MSSYSLIPGYNTSWIPAALEPPPDVVNVEHGVDPRQIYCDHIFHPGKFQRNVISKALVVILIKELKKN